MKKIKITIYLFLVFFGILFFTKDSLAATNFWFESAMIKIRQDAIVGNQSSWQIKSAKNEFEPFQLVLKSDQALSQVDVEITDFTGSGGTISNSNVTIFLEKYINVTQASTLEGATGEWPDALCPKVDAYYHEKRNCFPFDLAAGRIQPIWFDVFIPKTAQAGSYTATVKVTTPGQTLFQGNVTLTVWNFTLPDTSSLSSIFSLSMDSTWKGHYGGTWPPGGMDTITDLLRLYMRAGLRHRLSFSPMPIWYNNWNGTDYASITDQYFQQSLQGFLGDGDPQVEYGSSMLTVLMGSFSTIYTSNVNCTAGYTDPPASVLTETRKRAEILASKLTAKQKSIYSVLPIDEPGGGEVGCGATNPTLDYNSAKAMAQEIKAAGLKVQITGTRQTGLLNTSITPPRNDYFDIWIPWFQGVVGHTWDMIFYNRRSEYDTDIANGAQLWWYQSCMTHGCGVFGGSSYNGNPQYGVEYPAIYSRIFPWMTFKYDVQGELYWDVNYSYGADPWNSLFMSNYYGNGDGTFFYPGVPDTVAAGLPYNSRGANTPSIGGIHNIPIESIRLKMIREGYEDYEYLKKLKDLGDEAFAQNQTAILVTNTYTFDKNVSDLYAVREAVASRILTLLGQPSDTTPPAAPSGVTVN